MLPPKTVYVVDQELSTSAPSFTLTPVISTPFNDLVPNSKPYKDLESELNSATKLLKENATWKQRLEETVNRLEDTVNALTKSQKETATWKQRFEDTVNALTKSQKETATWKQRFEDTVNALTKSQKETAAWKQRFEETVEENVDLKNRVETLERQQLVLAIRFPTDLKECNNLYMDDYALYDELFNVLRMDDANFDDGVKNFSSLYPKWVKNAKHLLKISEDNLFDTLRARVNTYLMKQENTQSNKRPKNNDDNEKQQKKQKKTQSNKSSINNKEKKNNSKNQNQNFNRKPSTNTYLMKQENTSNKRPKNNDDNEKQQKKQKK